MESVDADTIVSTENPNGVVLRTSQQPTTLSIGKMSVNSKVLTS